MSQEDEQSLRDFHKSLVRKNQNSVPRIKADIDMLEGFLTKSLKNKVTDDNKKRQEQISDTKKQFDSLSRKISVLHGLVTQNEKGISNLKNSFQNEDVERDIEIANSLIDQISGCKYDIDGSNGDKEGNK